MNDEHFSSYGILPVNKATACNSFQLVSLLRKRTKIATIGHAGTLDPFATGVMVMLIGRPYTKMSNQFLSADKQYRATLRLGQTTNTFDIDGQVLSESPYVPTITELEQALLFFQGSCTQIPPMYSAKKIQGKRLYELARKGLSIERSSVPIQLSTLLIRYEYPYIELDVTCSKGTYIRVLAQDLGQMLGCGAFVSILARTRSGNFLISECIDQAQLIDATFDLIPFLKKI